MAGYTQRLQSHLAEYKLARLGVEESGTFTYRGRVQPYPHILPRQLRWLNLLEPIRREVREYLDSHPEIQLHEYFHHLNSSQAFALNLFFPFFGQGAGNALLQALRQPGEFNGWEPEHVADPVEGTNVDILWQTSDGAKTYCEIKLSEPEFGTARDDSRHRRKLDEIYRPVLQGLVADEWLTPGEFFPRYQLFRNVWLAARDERSSVLFLLPRANTGLWSQLPLFLNLLASPMAQRVKVMAIEDVLDNLAASPNLSPRLAGYLPLLREKYLLPATTAP